MGNLSKDESRGLDEAVKQYFATTISTKNARYLVETLGCDKGWRAEHVEVAIRTVAYIWDIFGGFDHKYFQNTLKLYIEEHTEICERLDKANEAIRIKAVEALVTMLFADAISSNNLAHVPM